MQRQTTSVAGGTHGGSTGSADAGPVLELSDSRARNAERAGNKAARLAELKQRGFRVPDGVALDARWCARVGGDPATVRDAVNAALRRLGDGPFAVRSSGVAEDGHEEAMAGRYRTELNVARDDVAEAVVRCLEAARFVDDRDGREHEPVAILVQFMVDADVAGVAFSKDPVTGDDLAVVSAVHGLADRLVSGHATGETWRVDGSRVQRSSGVEEVLDEAQVRRVVEELERIADEFDGPQDVEWAWKDDELFVLQARPITALPVPPPEEPLPDGTWIKDETHYPNGLTPLGASVFAPALEEGGAHAFRRWGLMIERVEQVVYRHEVYGKPVPAGGKAGPPPPALLLGILARIIPTMRRLTKTARQALESGLGAELMERWEREDRSRLEEELRALREAPKQEMSDEELRAHFDECVQSMFDGQRIHFMLFLPYVTSIYDLAMFTEEELGWDVHETLELLIGLSEETSGPARALRETAERAAENDEIMDVLRDRNVPDDQLTETLHELDPDFGAAWDAFVERFGHRTMGYGPGEATLAERPGVIRSRLLESTEHAGSRLEALKERRENAEESARSQLSPSKLDRFDELLDTARRRWPIREENVAYTDSMTNAVTRYAGLEIGRRLTERGQLARPEDMVMLSRDELFDALEGGHDVRDVVRRRKAERDWVSAHPGPRVLGGEEEPMPDMSYMPEPIRRTTGAVMWMMEFEYSANDVQEGDAIAGVPGAPGRATGTVRIVNGPEDFHRVRAGDIMVCPTTTPAWTIVFGTLTGIVAEGGGALAHAAIAAREHHLPAVLGVPDARQRLEDGATVEIDGTNGTVRVIE